MEKPYEWWDRFKTDWGEDKNEWYEVNKSTIWRSELNMDWENGNRDITYWFDETDKNKKVTFKSKF